MRGGQCHAAGARRTTPREIPPLVSLTTYRACSLLGGGASQELTPFLGGGVAFQVKLVDLWMRERAPKLSLQRWWRGPLLRDRRSCCCCGICQELTLFLGGGVAFQVKLVDLWMRERAPKLSLQRWWRGPLLRDRRSCCCCGI